MFMVSGLKKKGVSYIKKCQKYKSEEWKFI